MKKDNILLVLELVCSAIMLWIVKEAHFECKVYDVDSYYKIVLFAFSIIGAVSIGRFLSKNIYVLFDNIISLIKK